VGDLSGMPRSIVLSRGAGDTERFAAAEPNPHLSPGESGERQKSLEMADLAYARSILTKDAVF